jgi:hypothetical protein
MATAQALGDRVVHLGGCCAKLAAKRLGGFLEQGEMVGVFGEDVARLLLRQQQPAAGGQRDTARVLARHAPGAIQRQHRGTRAGRSSQGGDLRLRHRFHTQVGVRQRLAQHHFRLAFRLARELRELHAQGRAELEQQARGDGALVVLDEVEVAGRDAQALGEGGLGELGVLAQATDGAADGGCGHLDELYKFSAESVNYLTGFVCPAHFPSVISQCNVNSSRPHRRLQEATS